MMYWTITFPSFALFIVQEGQEGVATSAKDAAKHVPPALRVCYLLYPDTGRQQEAQERQFYFKENIFKCNLQFIHEE